MTSLTCHVPPVETKHHQGTQIQFWPDKESNASFMLIVTEIEHHILLEFTRFLAAVFTTEIQFDYNTLAGRIRELAFLNPKVCWEYNDFFAFLSVCSLSKLTCFWYIFNWESILPPISDRKAQVVLMFLWESSDFLFSVIIFTYYGFSLVELTAENHFQKRR